MKKFKKFFYLFLLQLIFMIPSMELYATEYDEGPYNIKDETTFDKKYQTFSFKKHSKKESLNNLYPNEEYKATFFEELSFNDLIPEDIESSILPKIYLSNVLFISGPHDYDTTVTEDNIPPEILKKIHSNGVKWEDISITNDITFKGYMDSNMNAGIKTLLQKIKIDFTLKPLSVQGTLGVEPISLLKKRMGYLKGDFLKNLSLTIDLPIPQIASFIGFKDLAFSINSGLYEKEPWKSLPVSLKKARNKDNFNVFITGGSWVDIAGIKTNTSSLLDFASKDTNATHDKEISIISIVENGFNFGGKLKINGINGFGGYKIDLKENKAAGKSDDFKAELSAFGGIDKYNKHFDFTADFIIDAHEKDKNKMIRLNYLQLNDNITLKDIIGNLELSNDLENSEIEEIRLQFNSEKFELDGIEAKTKLFGEEVDFYFFEYGNGEEKSNNFAFNLEKSFTLDKLLPENERNATIVSHLKKIAIPKTMFFISGKEIKTNRKDIKNVVLTHVYDKIYNDPAPTDKSKYSNDTLRINGMGFIANFDAKNFDKVGKAAKKLGAVDNTMISADLAGIFDSKPFAMDLYVSADLEKSEIPKNVRKKFKFPKSVVPRVHIAIMKDAFAVGLGGIIEMGGKGPGDVAGEIQIDVSDDGLGLNFVGMIDEWKHPLGAPSVTLNDFMLEFKIDDEATVTPGFNAKVTYLGKTTDIGGTLRLEVGDAGIPLPVGIAFKGQIEELNSETWVYMDNAIIIILLVGAALGLTIGGVGLIIGIASGGVAIIIAAAVTATASVAILAVFSNIVGPALTIGAISDIVYENIKHPEKVEKAFKDMEKLDIGDALKQIGQAVVFPVKSDFKSAEKGLGILEAKILTMKNVYISFATPGDADNTLGIPEGFSVSGSAYLFNTIPLGHQTHNTSVSNSDDKSSNTTLTAMQSPTDIKNNPSTKGRPARDFKLGPLDFKENKLYTRPNPLGITSKVEIFGIEEDVTIKIDKDFYFDSVSKLGAIGDVNLSFTYDKQNDDFTVIADLTSSIEPILKKEIKNGIDELISAASLSANAVKKDLLNATQAVTKASDFLAKKLKSEANFIAKDPKVENLEKNLNDAISYAENGVISHINSACNHLPGKKCVFSRCYDAQSECKDGFSYLIKKAKNEENALKESLQTAKNSVAIPKALSDDYQKAKKELDDKMDLKARVQALSDNLKNAANYLDNLKKDIDSKLSDNTIIVKEAILLGKISDVKKGDALILELKYTLNSQERTDYFGFKPSDIVYNAKALALLPVLVLDNFVKKEQKHEVKYLTNWLFALVDKQFRDITSGIEKELAADENKYSNILTSYRNTKTVLLESTLDFQKEHGQTLSKYTMTDMMPRSKEFVNRYIAVGHSSLCLGVASNGVDVFQENCKDIQTEQWSAKSLDNEYVELKSKGLCLKAKNADARSGQPLILSQCNSKDDHEQWKIISSDGFYDKIVNKFSQKCLHFDIENANPHTAYATWASCLGMDSQTFRDISDAERPTHHNVEDMVEAKSGSCLSTAKAFDQYFKNSAKGSLTTTKRVYDDMIRKGDDVLLSLTCDADVEDKFNYVEMVDGDIKLVHAQSGWCVTPQSHNSEKLVLKPCNKNKNMFWRNQREGDSFEMRNMYMNKCMTLEKSSKNEKFASISNCSKEPEQLIEFVK